MVQSDTPRELFGITRGAGGAVGEDAQHDLIQTRAPLVPVFGILFEDNVAALTPFLQAKGAGADRLLHDLGTAHAGGVSPNER